MMRKISKRMDASAHSAFEDHHPVYQAQEESANQSKPPKPNDDDAQEEKVKFKAKIAPQIFVTFAGITQNPLCSHSFIINDILLCSHFRGIWNGNDGRLHIPCITQHG